MPSLRYKSATAIRRSPFGASQPDDGAERGEHRRRIGRRDGKTSPARRRHPARFAVFLHAEVDRLPPLVVLVVVVAPRVEAEVAAERSHVAKKGRRDLRDGLPQARVAFAQRRNLEQVAERHARADRQPVAVGTCFNSATPRRPTSTAGVCCRRFMFGRTSVPPATSIASPFAAARIRRLRRSSAALDR